MKNILIVDDEETIRLALFEWFATKNFDFEILMAENGKDAVTQLTNNKIDLLVTDLNMPKMDGFELLAYMKNKFASTPVMVMTAFVTPEIRKKVTELGAVQFLEKPLKFDELEEIDFNKILEKPKSGAGGHVSGISLQSFLQLIGMENKTCTLNVNYKDKTGLIYLKSGELYDAKVDNKEGEEAAYEIATWADDSISIEIENTCPDIERKINFTIMHLLMEAARMQDELSGGDEEEKDEETTAPPAEVKPAAPQTESKAVETKPSAEPVAAPIQPKTSAQESPAPDTTGQDDEDLVPFNLKAVQKALNEFTAIDGFAGVALLSPSGESIHIVTNSDNYNMDQVCVFANNLLVNAQKASADMGTGKGKIVHLETDTTHVLIRCVNQGRDPLKTEAGMVHVHLVLLLTSGNSLGMAKMMLGKKIDLIVDKLVG